MFSNNKRGFRMDLKGWLSWGLPHKKLRKKTLSPILPNRQIHKSPADPRRLKGKVNVINQYAWRMVVVQRRAASR